MDICKQSVAIGFHLDRTARLHEPRHAPFGPGRTQLPFSAGRPGLCIQSAILINAARPRQAGRAAEIIKLDSRALARRMIRCEQAIPVDLAHTTNPISRLRGNLPERHRCDAMFKIDIEETPERPGSFHDPIGSGRFKYAKPARPRVVGVDEANGYHAGGTG